MKKYAVDIIRWEPQSLRFEIEAENSLLARSLAVSKVHAGDFDEAQADNTRPIRTTVMSCVRIRAKETGETINAAGEIQKQLTATTRSSIHDK